MNKSVSDNDTVVVKIERELETIVPGYLANRHKDLETIRQALEQSNFAAIQMIGHKMKGSGSGYGFDFITDLGRRLELAARHGETENICTVCQALTFYLARLEIHWEQPEEQPRCA